MAAMPEGRNIGCTQYLDPLFKVDSMHENYTTENIPQKYLKFMDDGDLYILSLTASLLNVTSVLERQILSQKASTVGMVGEGFFMSVILNSFFDAYVKQSVPSISQRAWSKITAYEHKRLYFTALRSLQTINGIATLRDRTSSKIASPYRRAIEKEIDIRIAELQNYPKSNQFLIK